MLKKLVLSIILFVLFFLSFASVVFSQTNYEFPKPKGWVSDYAKVMDQQSATALSVLLYELNRKSGVEVAVVTVKSIAPYDIETYANLLFERWGIGSKNDDTGLLIVISMDEKKIRIETGYGLEGMIPDSFAGELLDKYFIPSFRQGEYSQGIVNGTAAVVQHIAGQKGVKLTGSPRIDNQGPARQKVSYFGIMIKLLVGVVLLILFIRHPELALLFILSSGGHHRGGGRYGGSFGDFGGGFGGFGGGLSGGGGASRGW